MDVPHAEFGDTEAAVAAFDDGPFLMLASEGADHVVAAANRGCRAAFGGREVLGRGLRDVVPEPEAEGWWRRFDRVFATGDEETVVGWRVPVPGDAGRARSRCLDVSLTPWSRPDGSIRGVLCVGHDVTDRPSTAPEQWDADRARRHQPNHGVVTALQDALLPADLPILPGLNVSAQYLLADDDLGAGGDWFDAVLLPDNRIAMVVGDVVGQGVEAAAAMGRLRAILQERLESGAGVAGALRSLNRFADRSPEAAGATVCIVAIDPQTGHLEYLTAGHPPPLVVDGRGGFRYLPPSGASPLTTHRTWLPAQDRLGSGELLVLYTDGLIDRPGRTSAESTLELAHVAREVLAEHRSPGHGPGEQGISAGILELMVGATGFRDDVTVLAVELAAAPADFDRSLPPERDSIRRVRTELGRWLDGFETGDLDKQAILHAFAEVVANAVDHAYAEDDGAEALAVHGSLTPDGQVQLTVADRGRWRPGTGRADGRGLALAGGLVDRLRVRHGNGTTVTIQHRLSRPARILHAPGRSRLRAPRDPVRPGFIEVALGSVRVRGPLDWLTADELRAGLLRATHAGAHEAVVDLTEVTQLASPAVQALFEAVARNHGHDTELSLVAPPGSPAQHVLEVVALPYARTGTLPG